MDLLGSVDQDAGGRQRAVGVVETELRDERIEQPPASVAIVQGPQALGQRRRGPA